MESLRVLSVAVVLLLLPCLAQAEPPPTAEELRQFATEAEKAFKLDDARGHHLRLAELYPRHQLADFSLLSAMHLAGLLGLHKEAAQAGKQFVKLYPLNEKTSEVALFVARSYEKAKSRKKAKKAYALFLKKYGKKAGLPAQVTAHTHLARLAVESGLRGRKEADRHYGRVSSLVKEAEAEGMADYSLSLFAGEAAFYRAELEWESFRKLKVNGDTKDQRQRMQKMVERMKEVQQEYSAVFETRSPRWILAAMFRTGEASEHVYSALVDAPYPSDLPDDQEFKDTYATALEDISFKFLDQAIQVWKQAAEKAVEFKERGPWVDKLMKKVERYAEQPADKSAAAVNPAAPALPTTPADKPGLEAVDASLAKKDYVAAERGALDLLKEDSMCSGTMLRLGIAWLRQGRVELAAYALDRATEVDADDELIREWRKEIALENLRRE